MDRARTITSGVDTCAYRTNESPAYKRGLDRRTLLLTSVAAGIGSIAQAEPPVQSASPKQLRVTLTATEFFPSTPLWFLCGFHAPYDFPGAGLLLPILKLPFAPDEPWRRGLLVVSQAVLDIFVHRIGSAHPLESLEPGRCFDSPVPWCEKVTPLLAHTATSFVEISFTRGLPVHFKGGIAYAADTGVEKSEAGLIFANTNQSKTPEERLSMAEVFRSRAEFDMFCQTTPNGLTAMSDGPANCAWLKGMPSSGGKGLERDSVIKK